LGLATKRVPLFLCSLWVRWASRFPILPLREAALQHACPFHNISDDRARAYRYDVVMKNSMFSASVHRVRRHSIQRIAALFAAGLFLAAASQRARATGPVKIPMTAERWTTVAGTVSFVEHMGKQSIELQEGDYKKHISPGVALLNGPDFRN